MNVVAYIRVSSSGQLDGDGPERQSIAIEKFCASNGHSLFKTFQEAISGTVEGLDRKAFTELLFLIDVNKDLKIEGIVIERLDRIARDLLVQEILLRELSKRNIKLFATDQGAVDLVAGGDPTRKLIRQVLGALAEFEKSNLVHRLRVARERVALETGVQCGGWVRYGAKPGEGPILDLMVQFRDSMSLRELSDFLNVGGFRKRNGRPWSFNAVADVLSKYK
jgi:DNA invertase Pin-like site-specific DNA recombinase